MYYTATAMTLEFETVKRRKALIWTAAIITVLLLLAILWTWQNPEPPKPKMADLIEINLGNDEEGFGTEQPLIKGEMNQNAQPEQIPQAANTPSQNNDVADDASNPDEKDNDAAAVTKPVTPTPKAEINKDASKPVSNTKPTAPVTNNVPKPQVPKVPGYKGPGNGGGNGADHDNYQYNQGNNPNGKGDLGKPNGNPDSYGNNPGGRVGGLRVSKGDRKIVNNYIFVGDLPKATINAIIRVSPDGRGTYVTNDKGSTSTDSRYVTAIRSYLPNIQFNKADHESIVTVPFVFKVQE